MELSFWTELSSPPLTIDLPRQQSIIELLNRKNNYVTNWTIKSQALLLINQKKTEV